MLKELLRDYLSELKHNQNWARNPFNGEKIDEIQNLSAVKQDQLVKISCDFSKLFTFIKLHIRANNRFHTWFFLKTNKEIDQIWNLIVLVKRYQLKIREKSVQKIPLEGLSIFANILFLIHKKGKNKKFLLFSC